ncbi:MAG: carbonic anhydrase [Elusimicrobiota bacterium]|nr:carbonic anhydrase [Elusimicrobiota bacterium]
MQKLIKGIHQFQSNIFTSQRELFERLAKKQEPETLFITCSDSRINPNLVTQTEPGDLFILRNAGNIVPPHGAASGGEQATIEFAVAGLGVKDIVLCGHSHCGAIKGLLHPEGLDAMPAVKSWLGHAEATRRIIQEKYPDRTGTSQLTTAVEENVLVQLENLRTHPAVAARLSTGKLKLHGWVYKIETGEVFSFDPATHEFQLVTEASGQPADTAGAI